MDDWINCLQTAAKDAIYADQNPKPGSGPNKLQVGLLNLFKCDIQVIMVNNLFVQHDVSQEDTVNEFNLNKQINYEETPDPKQSISKIRELPGNDVCVDCKCKGN